MPGQAKLSQRKAQVEEARADKARMAWVAQVFGAAVAPEEPNSSWAPE